MLDIFEGHLSGVLMFECGLRMVRSRMYAIVVEFTRLASKIVHHSQRRVAAVVALLNISKYKLF